MSCAVFFARCSCLSHLLHLGFLLEYKFFFYISRVFYIVPSILAQVSLALFIHNFRVAYKFFLLSLFIYSTLHTAHKHAASKQKTWVVLALFEIVQFAVLCGDGREWEAERKEWDGMREKKTWNWDLMKDQAKRASRNLFVSFKKLYYQRDIDIDTADERSAERKEEKNWKTEKHFHELPLLAACCFPSSL